MSSYLPSCRSRLVRAATALLAFGIGLGGVASAQQREANFRADVDRVLLHVAVIDPRGGEVPPLTVDDFRVYDDDVKQDIELFVQPADAPLDIALVLDSSASMKPVETSARRAARTLLNKLGLDDCVFVLPFSDVAGPGRWGRSADPDLRGFIGSIRAAGGTALHDALLEGLAELERAHANELVGIASEAEERAGEDDEAAVPEEEQRAGARGAAGTVATETESTATADAGAPPIVLPPRRTSLQGEIDSAVRTLDLTTPPPVRGCGEALPDNEPTTAANARRKALIVLSDGADMDSTASFYDALGAARAASVPVFPVALGYANNEPGLKENLAELARATGGRLIESAQPGALEASYDEVVALLRSYYLIGYEPGVVTASGRGPRPRWHDVRVELRRPNFVPLVRPGYYR